MVWNKYVWMYIYVYLYCMYINIKYEWDWFFGKFGKCRKKLIFLFYIEFLSDGLSRMF